MFLYQKFHKKVDSVFKSKHQKEQISVMVSQTKDGLTASSQGDNQNNIIESLYSNRDIVLKSESRENSDDIGNWEKDLDCKLVAGQISSHRRYFPSCSSVPMNDEENEETKKVSASGIISRKAAERPNEIVSNVHRSTYSTKLSFPSNKFSKRDNLGRNWKKILSTHISKAKQNYEFTNFSNTSTISTTLNQNSPYVFAYLSAYLKICSTSWLDEFIQAGGLKIIMEKLSAAQGKKHDLTRALSQVMLAQVMRKILITDSGLMYVRENRDRFFQCLFTLITTGIMLLKDQVIKMLTEMCVNIDGYQFVRDAVLTSYDLAGRNLPDNHQYCIVTAQLLSADSICAYKATVATFINTLIMSAIDAKDRMTMRNKFYDLGLPDVFNSLKNENGLKSDVLLKQVMIFETLIDIDTVNVEAPKPLEKLNDGKSNTQNFLHHHQSKSSVHFQIDDTKNDKEQYEKNSCATKEGESDSTYAICDVDLTDNNPDTAGKVKALPLREDENGERSITDHSKTLLEYTEKKNDTTKHKIHSRKGSGLVIEEDEISSEIDTHNQDKNNDFKCDNDADDTTFGVDQIEYENNKIKTSVAKDKGDIYMNSNNSSDDEDCDSEVFAMWGDVSIPQVDPQLSLKSMILATISTHSNIAGVETLPMHEDRSSEKTTKDTLKNVYEYAEKKEDTIKQKCYPREGNEIIIEEDDCNNQIRPRNQYKNIGLNCDDDADSAIERNDRNETEKDKLGTIATNDKVNAHCSSCDNDVFTMREEGSISKLDPHSLKGEKEQEERYLLSLPSLLDTDDPQQLLQSILMTVAGTPAAKHLLSILKHLLMIDSQSENGIQMWQDIDHFTNQRGLVSQNEEKNSKVRCVQTIGDGYIFDMETLRGAAKTDLDMEDLSTKYLPSQEKNLPVMGETQTDSKPCLIVSDFSPFKTVSDVTGKQESQHNHVTEHNLVINAPDSLPTITKTKYNNEAMEKEMVSPRLSELMSTLSKKYLDHPQSIEENVSTSPKRVRRVSGSVKHLDHPESIKENVSTSPQRVRRVSSSVSPLPTIDESSKHSFLPQDSAKFQSHVTSASTKVEPVCGINWSPTSRSTEDSNIQASTAALLSSTRSTKAWPPKSLDSNKLNVDALAQIRSHSSQMVDWPPKIENGDTLAASCSDISPPVRYWPTATTSEASKSIERQSDTQDLFSLSPIEDRPTSPPHLSVWPKSKSADEVDIDSAYSPPSDLSQYPIPIQLQALHDTIFDTALVSQSSQDDPKETTTLSSSSTKPLPTSSGSSYNAIPSKSILPIPSETLNPLMAPPSPDLSASREVWHRQMLLNPPPPQVRSLSAPAFEVSSAVPPPSLPPPRPNESRSMPDIPGIPPPPPPPLPPPPLKESRSVPGIPGTPPPPPPPPPDNFTSMPDIPGTPSPLQRSASLPHLPQLKMKKLQWKKIPTYTLNRSQSSIWKRVNSVECVYVVDDKIEKLFAEPEVKKTKKEKNAPKETEICLLEPRISMNINIFLKQFKGGGEEFLKLMKAGKSNLLDGDRLRCLEKLLPDENLVKVLKSFSGDKKKVGTAERFLLKLISIPSYAFRINTLILKEDFEASIEKLKPSIATLKQAIEDILNNDILPEILSIILSVGNFMNHGSHAGNATAFKITSLLKLTDTRANNNSRITLLHYIVQIAEEKQLRLLEFPKMMPKLDEACLLNIEHIENDVQKFKKSLETTVKHFDKSTRDLKKLLGAFFENAIRECFDLEQDIKEIGRLSKALAEYLCEDPKKFVIEDNLKVFQNFCNALTKAQQENKHVKEMEARKILMAQKRVSLPNRI